MGPKEEYLDVVDENDNILGKATWREMEENGLLHRSANIFVFNSKGDIFVHKRAKTIRYPGMWDVKFGGLVSAGESYGEAARRESQEEAGIANAKLEFLFDFKFREKTHPVGKALLFAYLNNSFPKGKLMEAVE